MADTYTPGLQFQDWTKVPSITDDAFGGVLRSIIAGPLVAGAKAIKGAISPEEKTPNLSNSASNIGMTSPSAVAPTAPPMQFDPPSNFPEVTQQQYLSPYKPGYSQPQFGVAPPNSLQGTMSPRINGLMQNQPQTMGTNPWLPETQTIWGKPNG